MIKLGSNKNNKNQFRDDDLICYCFNYTKIDIEEDFNKNDGSTILEKITKEKSIGGCHCEVKNPKGRWTRGTPLSYYLNLARVYKKIK